MSVGVVLVGVALVNVVDMTGLIAVVLVAVTLVYVMDVARFVPMVLVVMVFMNVVRLHCLSFPNGMMDSVGLRARPR